MFKAAIQPLCRYCGAGIKKATHTVYFGQSWRNDTYSTSRPEMPKSREEAQRLLNQTIVSVSWRYEWIGEWPDQVKRRDYIGSVTTWDGESYRDEFFCNGEHARDFGYAAARAGQVMAAYNEAKASRDG